MVRRTRRSGIRGNLRIVWFQQARSSEPFGATRRFLYVSRGRSLPSQLTRCGPRVKNCYGKESRVARMKPERTPKPASQNAEGILLTNTMPRHSTSEDTSLESIRRDWDARARENPRAYINWPDIANEEGAFFNSGRADYDRYIHPFLQKMDFEPSGKVALEIGCGIGRLARWAAADF